MNIGGLECAIIGAVIVGILLTWNYIAVTLQERREGLLPPSEPVINETAASDEHIRSLIAGGKKMEAIKLYRLLTGEGLKEAKDAVEYLTAHPDEAVGKKKKAAYDSQDAGLRDLITEGRIDEAVEVYAQFAGVDEFTARDAVAEIEQEITSSETSGATDEDMARIRRLVSEGNKIEAIKAYRELTGLGLKEAKDAIDGME